MINQFRKEYNWLSNFASVDIEFMGRVYPSVENAYMSAKSPEKVWKLFCSNPKTTAAMCKKRSKEIQIRAGWDDMKLQVMEYLLKLKFNQEPYRTLLKETKDEYIQEGNYWNDKFWGFCLKTNEGENHLGKLIMEIRKTL